MFAEIIAGLSLVGSATTAWVTLWRRGTIRMAQPPTLYFGPDGAREHHPKVFVRALMYSTARRGRIVEGMFVRVVRGDSTQTFPVWVCGSERGGLSRGAGLAVGSDGVALHHHFLLPRDGTTFQFLAGAYTVDLHAVLVGTARPMKLCSVSVDVSESQAARLQEDLRCGLYFDWSPETGRYTGHLDNARLREELPPFLILAPPGMEPGDTGNDRIEAGNGGPKALGGK